MSTKKPLPLIYGSCSVKARAFRSFYSSSRNSTPPSIHSLHPRILLPAIYQLSSADGCKCTRALLLFVAVVNDAPASSVAVASGTRLRLAQPKTMEETMRVLTMIELTSISRIELCELLSNTTKSLPELSIGSNERNNALTNLRNICSILSGRELFRG